MVTFFHMTMPRKGSLAHRRLMWNLRRWAAACAAAAAACAVSAMMYAMTATMPVAVANASIRRGSTITAVDVTVVDMPASSTVRGLVASADAVIGRIAQIDIETGQPFTTHMARDAPILPDGHTVIEVRLSSDADWLIAGDTVSLVSIVGCDAFTDMEGTALSRGDKPTVGTDSTTGDATKNTTKDTTTSGGASVTPDGGQSCVLAQPAMAMGNPRDDDSASQMGSVVPFAMSADDAARVMTVQEAGAIVAVTQTRAS